MKPNMLKLLAAGVCSAALACGAQAGQGVTDTEVVIGSNGDLSGIFAPFNVQAIKAAQLVFDEVNAAGGVHGRTIRFVVEDHQYQMPKAMANFNKLVNADQAFAMILNLGTPMNLAGFPLMEAKEVANISPLTASKEMLSGNTDFKYAGTSSYYDQMLAGVDYLVGEKGAEEVCAMYIPSDFGKEIQSGAKTKAEELGKTWGAETTHKPDESEFVGALTKLKDAGCDVIATALGVRQTIVAVATAKKIGWTDATFIGSSAAFHEAIAAQPGGITEGYYAAAGWSDYKPRLGDPEVKTWYDAFKAKFDGEEPGMAAILGNAAAQTLVKGLEAAGPDLNADSFRQGMESLNFRDPVGDSQFEYSADSHQGADDIVISVVKGGVFEEVARK
ncbi:ABC transporter substrate-binding protein [Oricola sp.]|uniref:ABC transporter substrate-binding protein n=1 Tax=Oricola sp. TaxID=1979950 RepID=UPI003BAC2939